MEQSPQRTLRRVAHLREAPCAHFVPGRDVDEVRKHPGNLVTNPTCCLYEWRAKSGISHLQQRARHLFHPQGVRRSDTRRNGEPRQSDSMGPSNWVHCGKGLDRKLMRYIRAQNEDPKPIKWKYDDPSRRIRPVPFP